MADLMGGNQRFVAFNRNSAGGGLFWISPGYQTLKVINGLARDRTVYCLYREPRKPDDMLPTFREIAASYVDTLRSIQVEGPYALIGFCVYGAIAFEMACQLARQSQMVSQLIMISPMDPGQTATEVLPEPLFSRLHHQANRSFYHYKKVRNLPVTEQLAYVKGSARRIIEAAHINLFIRNQRTGGNPTPHVPGRLADIHQSDIYAFKMHKLEPYSGSAVILRPLMAPHGIFDYPNRRWRNLLLDDLEIDEVPGDADSMWSEPEAAAQLLLKIGLYMTDGSNVASRAAE